MPSLGEKDSGMLRGLLWGHSLGTKCPRAETPALPLAWPRSLAPMWAAGHGASFCPSLHFLCPWTHEWLGCFLPLPWVALRNSWGLLDPSTPLSFWGHWQTPIGDLLCDSQSSVLYTGCLPASRHLPKERSWAQVGLGCSLPWTSVLVEGPISSGSQFFTVALRDGLGMC